MSASISVLVSEFISDAIGTLSFTMQFYGQSQIYGRLFLLSTINNGLLSKTSNSNVLIKDIIIIFDFAKYL